MRLPIKLMPAAGWCKTVAHVRKLAEVPVISHIVMGSFTVKPREGNTGGTNFVTLDDGTSFNALGLPNGGIPYLKEHLPEMVRIAGDAGKIPVVSIAGDTPHDYLKLALYVATSDGDLIEVNFGCPNKFGDKGAQQEIASYNLDLMRETLELFNHMDLGLPLWIKLSPYVNPEERVRVARLIADAGLPIGCVTICNTLPNCVPRDEHGNKLITAQNTNGRAGMAGTGLRHIALANVEHFRELFREEVGIIGAGGIDSGAALAAYYRRGCWGAQIGTAFFKDENPRIFEQVAAEFVDLVELS